MRSDALFQLGMGPVELDATQTEDFSSPRPVRAGIVDFRKSAVRPCARKRLRGNSTKALLPPA